VGLLAGTGVEVPGTATTLSTRVGGGPRLAFSVRAGLVGLGALVAIPALLRKAKKTHVDQAAGLTALWLYALIAGLSTLYSVAPIVTGPKAVELAVGLAIITSLFLSPTPTAYLKQAITFVVGLDLALISVAIVGFFAIPSVFASLEYRPGFLFARTMSSPWASSNSLSAAGSVVAAFALAQFLKAFGTRKLGWLVAFTVGTVATVLASGRQGVAMWLVAVGLLLVVHRRRLFFLLLGPAAVGLVLMNWDLVLSILSRNQSESSLLLLTGRLRFWTAALSAISQHPWTGFGFGAGGRFVALASIGEGARSNLHSGYLEALTGVGIIGLAPLLFSVALAVRWSVRRLIQRVDTAYAILIVPLILHTLVDLGFGAWLKPDFLIIASLVALSDLEQRSPRVIDPHGIAPQNSRQDVRST